MRPDVTIGDLARVAGAYAQLLESDRLARWGADELPLHHPREAFADVSDEELYAKVADMLERHPVNSVQ